MIDGEKAVEVKFHLLHSKEYRYKSWRALKHQLDYNKEYPEIHWGLGFYALDREIKGINPEKLSLDKIVMNRELYLVEWDWMKQFPIYHETGETGISKWDNYLIFARFNLIPEVIASCDVGEGKVFFTKGVNPERFKINTKLL